MDRSGSRATSRGAPIAGWRFRTRVLLRGCFWALCRGTSSAFSVGDTVNDWVFPSRCRGADAPAWKAARDPSEVTVVTPVTRFRGLTPGR